MVFLYEKYKETAISDYYRFVGGFDTMEAVYSYINKSESVIANDYKIIEVY